MPGCKQVIPRVPHICPFEAGKHGDGRGGEADSLGGEPQGARAAGAGRRLPGGSVPHLRGLKGPRGGAGGLLQGGGAAHQSREAVPVLLFLLLPRLPSRYRALFLLLPGGSFLRRRPGFLGAEAVGAAAWRPPVPLATRPPRPARAGAGGRGRARGGGAGAAAPRS